jgi:hypothetical protein
MESCTVSTESEKQTEGTMPSFPKELYTPRVLASLGGASTAVLVASGSIGNAFSFNPKWLSFLLALLVAFAGLCLLEDKNKWNFPMILIALLNGTLIYAQATGINTLDQAIPSQPRNTSNAALVPTLDPVPWWSSAQHRSVVAGAAKNISLLAISMKNAAASLGVQSRRRAILLDGDTFQRLVSTLKADSEVFHKEFHPHGAEAERALRQFDENISVLAGGRALWNDSGFTTASEAKTALTIQYLDKCKSWLDKIDGDLTNVYSSFPAGNELSSSQQLERSILAWDEKWTHSGHSAP